MPARFFTALVLLLAILAFVLPGVDAMMFGIHEHAEGGQRTALGGGDITPSHHCELSANPAGIGSIALATSPTMLTWMIASDASIATHHAPPAPATPPRS